MVQVLTNSRITPSSREEHTINGKMLASNVTTTHFTSVDETNLYIDKPVILFNIINRTHNATIEKKMIVHCANSGEKPNFRSPHARGKLSRFIEPTIIWYFFILPVASIK